MKAQFVLFNIEGYGEFFSGITPSDRQQIELSYRIHLKFNLSDAHISWKGYLFGSLTPKINIHLRAYKKKQISMENLNIFMNKINLSN
jgi:hypothetical protein